MFNDKAVNAFALPSGKMGVYTGLLQVSVNQHQLVAVLGHEVAHVIANYSNERVSVVFATNSGMKMT
jgi:predicted Zn-dependent protease